MHYLEYLRSPPILTDLQKTLRTMSSFSPLPTDDLGINTIRVLAADVVGKANSGHPVSAHSYIPSFATPPARNLGRTF